MKIEITVAYFEHALPYLCAPIIHTPPIEIDNANSDCPAALNRARSIDRRFLMTNRALDVIKDFYYSHLKGLVLAEGPIVRIFLLNASEKFNIYSEVYWCELFTVLQ